jgi:TonB family protein
MILARKNVVAAALSFAVASHHTFASEPTAQALAGVPRVTREQMWIASPEPNYPAEALKQHLTGRGVFNLKIRPKTYTVSEVAVVKSTGYKILDDAAIKALSRWCGRPSELMSRTDHVHVPVVFQ